MQAAVGCPRLQDDPGQFGPLALQKAAAGAQGIEEGMRGLVAEYGEREVRFDGAGDRENALEESRLAGGAENFRRPAPVSSVC